MNRDDAQLLADLKAEAYRGSSAFHTFQQEYARIESGNIRIYTTGFPEGNPRIEKDFEDLSTLSTFRRTSLLRNKTRPGPLTLNQVRYRVFERDRGICQLCRINTLDLDQAIRLVRGMCEIYRWNPLDHKIYWEDQFQSFLNAVGIRASLWPEVLWEADHVIPRCRGGKYALENLRTLCLLCHRRETNRLLFGKETYAFRR